MEVYIVTSGEYSDYRIEAVFKSEEKAKIYAMTHACDIEPWETEDDKIKADKSLSKKICYKYHFTYDNLCSEIRLIDREISKIGTNEISEKHWSYKIIYYVTIYTSEGYEKAEKIALDLIAKYKAQKEGV